MVMAARHLRTNFHPRKKNICLVKFWRHKKRRFSVILAFILEKNIYFVYFSNAQSFYSSGKYTGQKMLAGNLLREQNLIVAKKDHFK